jgi:hypothetical protein
MYYGLIAVGLILLGAFIGPVVRVALAKVTSEVIGETAVKLIEKLKADVVEARNDRDAAKVQGMKDIQAVKREADAAIADAKAEAEKLKTTIETLTGMKQPAGLTPAPVPTSADSGIIPATIMPPTPAVMPAEPGEPKPA